MKTLLPQADLDRIGAAVTSAERGGSGEIVVALVRESDGYEETLWRGGAAFALLGLLADAAFRLSTGTWPAVSPLEGVGALAFLGGAGALLTRFVPGLRRLFGRDRMVERSALAAEAMFLEKKVYATRDRTGMLLFVSFLERRVIVLADEGIDARVPKGSWDGVVASIVAGMKAGRPADGVVEAVETCGRLLREAGFAARPDDADELPNAPVVR